MVDPLIDEEGEVRELTADEMKLFAPIAEVLPPETVALLPVRGRDGCQGETKRFVGTIDVDGAADKIAGLLKPGGRPQTSSCWLGKSKLVGVRS